MGIKKFNSYLQQLNLIKEFDDIETVIKYIKTLIIKPKDYMFITIDTSLYLYKYIRAEKMNPKISFISLFKKQICKLLKYNVIPIYIFDGIPDNLKSDTISKRLETKNNAYIKIKDLSLINQDELTDDDKKELINKITKLSLQTINITNNDCKKLQHYFDSINIPYIVSPCESDVLCAKLVQSGYADACMSEDMDILIYGCNILIKSHGGKYYIYQYDNIIKTLDISTNQLCKFATLLGSDYSRSANSRLQANELLQICKDNNFNFHNILKNIIIYDYHRKYYDNEQYTLSLSELSDNVLSDNKTNDNELLQKIHKYYDLAFELLNFYNNNNIINLVQDNNILINNDTSIVNLYNYINNKVSNKFISH